MTNLILFDQDLRIKDNPAFYYGMQDCQNILPLYILDEKNKRELGKASKWFLHHGLEALDKELKKNYDLNLITKQGDSLKILEDIFKSNKIKQLYFNRLCEPYNIELHKKIKLLAKKYDVKVFTYLSQTLFEFDEIKTLAGEYFKVFTPFYKNCQKHFNKIERPLEIPIGLRTCVPITNSKLSLLPKTNWYKNFNYEFNYIKIENNFKEFLKNNLKTYKDNRNFPNLNATSKISPYLAFGMISPRWVFNQVGQINQFMAEIIWREFSHHLTFHFPQIDREPFKKKFTNFPWQDDKKSLKLWQKGLTGYPIVDAGMRELWHSGKMHNRVRMIVGSFLIKDLLIHWKEGEKWFWDCLVDANFASNYGNWQWVAGTGADAAPYFRIFNPTLQSQRFDPKGDYIRKWVPELSKLSDKLIHEPWKSDISNYPKPIVDHKRARDLAMEVYKSLKNNY